MDSKDRMWSLRGVLAVAMCVAMACGTAQAKGGTDTVLTLPLSGAGAEAAATGQARYRVGASQTKVEIEVEHLTQTTAVTFLLDGVALGAAGVSLGQANLELESETATVPVLTADSQIVVTDTATGAIVAATANANPGTEGEGEGEGSNDDPAGHEGEGEGEGSNDDPAGHEGEGEGEGSNDDPTGHEGEGEGSSDDPAGHEGEGEGEGSSDDPAGHEGEGEGEGQDDSGVVEITLNLHGTEAAPLALGTAELKNDNDRRRIEMEATGITAARVSVLVDGVNVGTAPVREGEAKVKRDERSNYTIPALSSTSRVDVIDSDAGTILLSTTDVPVVSEPPATDGIQLTLKLGANGTYLPGQTVVIEANLSYDGDSPVTALSYEQSLPAGWTFVQSLDDLGAFLTPVAGDDTTLTWAWIQIPAFPATLRFEVMVPATAAGNENLSGNVVYRRMAGEEFAVAALHTPAGQGYTEDHCHSFDSNRDWHIELSEVTRSIQFYNAGSFHCEDGTEDGYAPGQGDDSCSGHDGDQLSPDWRIDLSELLRTVQLYHGEDHAYVVENGTEDGFHPGRFHAESAF